MGVTDKANFRVDADTTLSGLIYLVLKAQPTRLHSNLQYIQDFSLDQLRGEEDYCLVQFVLATNYIEKTLAAEARNVLEPQLLG